MWLGSAYLCIVVWLIRFALSYPLDGSLSLAFFTFTDVLVVSTVFSCTIQPHVFLS